MAHRRGGSAREEDTATTEVHSDATEAEVESGENTAVLKGLLQCMLGIGGLAIFLWILFFFLVPPLASNVSSRMEQASEPVCTQVGSVKQLIEELKEVVEWRTLGEELGMEAQLLQEIESSNKENEHKKRAMIRAWVDGSVRRCWEAIIEALKATNKTKVAKSIADKYGCSWNK